MLALQADATLILLMLCDPPHLADIRESLEVARAAGCARVAVAPLGGECAAPAASALARYVQCQLALAHCAPYSLALGAAAGRPELLAPSPATAGDTTCVPHARRQRWSRCPRALNLPARLPPPSPAHTQRRGSAALGCYAPAAGRPCSAVPGPRRGRVAGQRRSTARASRHLAHRAE
jgi:hypothetical protein